MEWKLSDSIYSECIPESTDHLHPYQTFQRLNAKRTDGRSPAFQFSLFISLLLDLDSWIFHPSSFIQFYQISRLSSVLPDPQLSIVRQIQFLLNASASAKQPQLVSQSSSSQSLHFKRRAPSVRRHRKSSSRAF